MAKKGLENTHPIIIKCAAFTTGVTLKEFRAKDVLFHIELIKNIVSSSPFNQDFDVQYTQVMRLLEQYHDRKWVQKEVLDNGKANFSFHSEGLFCLLESMVKIDRQLPVSEVLFSQSFLDSYRSYILDQVFKRSKLDPKKYEALELILSPNYLIHRQVEILDRAIQDFEYRLKESDKLLDYVEKHKHLSPQEMVDQLPSEFSYRMSYLKPFREWLGNLPENLLKHEFTAGFESRNKGYYKMNLKHLKGLRSFYMDSSK